MEQRVKRESIINRSAMKKYIIAQAEAIRPGWKCSRVSADALDQIEAFVRAKVRDSVDRQPSNGKTYKSFY